MLLRTMTVNLLLLMTLLNAAATQAAFCALRDPTKALADLFPEATSSRSIVTLIDDDVRNCL